MSSGFHLCVLDKYAILPKNVRNERIMDMETEHGPAGREAFLRQLRAFALPEWAQLPDLGLYMDQVVTFLERVYQGVFGGTRRLITPAMINNYVKAGLVSRPVGKKYDRAQLAQLIMLCTLKQSISLEDLKPLITPAPGEDIQEIYGTFCKAEHVALQKMADVAPAMTPMDCAVTATAFQLLCQRALYTDARTEDIFR